MPEWIRVHDRLPDLSGLLPDEGVYVLVSERWIDGDGNYLADYVSICGFDRDGWSRWDNFGQVRPERITHWMPLPEPPKQED